MGTKFFHLLSQSLTIYYEGLPLAFYCTRGGKEWIPAAETFQTFGTFTGVT